MDTDPTWRDDPSLSGRFHPDSPDDLQVIVHEGGPRLSQAAPELIWVRVTGHEGPLYQGQLLNVPHNLRSMRQGSSILFMAPSGAEHPILFTRKYLSERAGWKITPCDRCGLPELFDAPSDLLAALFPDVPPGAQMEGFTSFCPLCGGVQIIEAASGAPQPSEAQPSDVGRPKWKFWK